MTWPNLRGNCFPWTGICMYSIFHVDPFVRWSDILILAVNIILCPTSINTNLQFTWEITSFMKNNQFYGFDYLKYPEITFGSLYPLLNLLHVYKWHFFLIRFLLIGERFYFFNVMICMTTISDSIKYLS